MAMHFRPVDPEIGGGIIWAANFGPDPGIARAQGIVGQGWPIAADSLVKAFKASGIHLVIKAIDPFDIRAEARLSTQIKRQMHPQSMRMRRRIDQMRKGRAPRQHKIIALGIKGGRNMCGVQARH